MRVNAVLLCFAAGVLVGGGVCLFFTMGGAAPVEADCQDQPCAEPPCCNGDCNSDGGVDISDAVYLLTYLFSGGNEPGAITSGGSCAADLAGIWNVDVSYHPNDCDMQAAVTPFEVRIKQEGCSITVISSESDEYTFDGYVCGDLVYWGGTLEYFGGVVTVQSFMKIESEESIRGVTYWSLTSMFTDCQGTEVYTARR